MIVKQALNLVRSGTITLATALVATLLLQGGVMAASISDPVGDFLPTYTGPQGADLDVVSSEVTLNGNQLFFSATLAGQVGTTAGASYVFGLNRGQGTQRFLASTPSTGAGVFFDSVVILRPDGTGQFNDQLNSANSTALTGVSVSGNQISATFNASLFPSTGFALSDYTWNLWPRVSSVTGTAGISDFAPDASNASVAVPEPASMSGLLAVAGFAAFFKAGKAKRKQA
jgi:hypothetical protein